MFLATATSGVIGPQEPDSDSNATLTPITFTNLIPKTGSNWETDLNDLGAKTSIGRGALFLPDKRRPYNSRIIESITATETAPGSGIWTGTLKVKGSVARIGTTGFGLVYGQAIRRTLNHANASAQLVEFHDIENGRSFAVD